MNSQNDSELLKEKTEALCEIIIAALREIRSAKSGPVTPAGLCCSLIQNSSFSDTLAAAAQFEGNGHRDLRVCARRLQRFQIDLLGILGSAFSQDFRARSDEFCLLAEKKSHLEELLALNDQILDFVNDATGQASCRQRELLELVGEVTKNLVEVEHFLSVSFSDTTRAYNGGLAYSETLERNVEDISCIVNTSQSIDELKSLIKSRLDAIREASRKKLELEKQAFESAGELDALRSQIKMMRRQVSTAHRRANAMERASLMDPLTGIANRRSYQKQICEEWDVYTRSGEAFSILMIDIDNFKSINDRFGHWAGDKCLAELAKRIKTNLRGADFIARYGGEEFIAVLPKTDHQGAFAVAEKLRCHVEETRFLYREDRVPLTISIGVSTVRETDKSIRSILDRVDKGLYEAKGSGRNCVTLV